MTTTLYTRLRAELRPPPALHEGSDLPPEPLLQAIWQHQRLRRHTLRTVGGHPLFILHPGFLNREPGPDFRHAVIQLGADTPQQGDVEVDLEPHGWQRHGHHNNPDYRRVVLHVVWKAGAGTPPPHDLPLLELQSALDSPLATLAAWLDRDPSPSLPEALRGRCSGPLAGLKDEVIERLLNEAALHRLQARADQFAAREG